MDGAGAVLLRAVLFCDAASPRPPDTARFEEIKAIVEAHGGTVLDTNGAGVVAGFATAGAAIDTGLGFMGEKPAFSVGISLGEVLIDGTDWFGTAVIEAARLHDLAAPGQILVSSVLADAAVAGRPPTFSDIGKRSLKGLPDQVHVFEAHAAVPDEWCEPLQVVLAIDMVESTQLLARLGDQESLRLRRLFERIVNDACADHDGRLIDQRGDGVVISFLSVSAAVCAASDVVQEVSASSMRVDVDAAFEVRAAVACQPGQAAATVAGVLLKQARPGQVLADSAAHRYSRDRGIEFDTSHAEFSIVSVAPTDLPLQRALRSEGAFVGRHTSLLELTNAWDQAVTGRLNVVEVTGEPGMGKTRLVSEFAARAASSGAAVIFGACDPELDIPYGPLNDALRQAAMLSQEFAGIVADDAVPVASALRAETMNKAGDAGPEDPGLGREADREQVFQRFAEVFSQLTACRPVVLVIDDLHWANALTLLVLRHIVASTPAIRLLIVGTYRAAEVTRGHPLLDLQAELLRLGAAPTVIELAPLKPSEVVGLVEDLMQGTADASARALVERVHRETDGSPFYSQELLRTLVEAQSLTVTGGMVSAIGDVDALPIPDTVRGMVSGRLNLLDNDVHRLLSLGAVAGPQFSLDMASAALGQPFDAIIDLAEAAEKVALVSEGDEPRTYAFAHAIVRSTLLDDLSATRLAATHEAIATALEQLPGDRNDALAHHWSRAAGPVADERALAYLAMAAERDVHALAWEAAITRYRLMLDRLTAVSPAPTAQLAETWLGLGAAMRALGDADYLTAVVEAGRCARRIDRADLLARAAIGSMKPGSWFANANETNDTIIGFCEDALAGLDDEDPTRVQVLAIMATSLAFESDRSRRVALVDEAVRLARALDQPTLLASALIAEHLALWDPTTLGRRQEIADELGQLARRRDLPEVEFLAGFFRASALLETGQVHELRIQLKGLAPLIERTGNFWFYFLVERMRIGLDIGQDVPATAAAVDALFEESAASQADAGGTWAAQHGGLAIHAGRMGDMADSLRSAAEGRRGQGIWSNALVIALLQRGERGEAIELARELKRPNLDFMWLVSMQMRAEVGYGLGDKELCREAIEELLPFRDRLGVIASGTLTYGLVATSIGEAAIGAGDYDLAIDVLTQAVRDAQRIEAPFFESKSVALLAEAHEMRSS